MLHRWVLETCVLCLTLSSAATGCHLLGSEEEVQEQVRFLDECRGDATDEEVHENIRITEEYAEGIAADIALSWRPVLFVLDFMILFGQTMGALESSQPVGWTFDSGTYRYGSDAAAIEMRIYLSEDLEYGPAGTRVVENILDLDSYLTGAVFEADTETDTVTITFGEPGPLVGLLGLGAAPTNPLTLHAVAREQVLETLGTLAIETEYVAYGVTQSTSVDYHAVSSRTTIASLTQDLPMEVRIVEVNASRELNDQVLTTESWDLEIQRLIATGTTTFTVSGGHFPFRGRIDFVGPPLAVFPSRELSCP